MQRVVLRVAQRTVRRLVVAPRDAVLVEHVRQARVVELRYFGGLNYEEIAEVLGVSSKTAKRDWSVARAWLYGQLAS